MFTLEQLDAIGEVFELALADPNFIDTTSGGGAGPEEAARLRRQMHDVQSEAMRQAAQMRTDEKHLLDAILTAATDSDYGPQTPIPSVEGLDMAYIPLCNAVTLATGNEDEDVTARNAAWLALHSPASVIAAVRCEKGQYALELVAEVVADEIRKLA